MGKHYDSTRPKSKVGKGDNSEGHMDSGGSEVETPMHEIISEHGPAHTTQIKKESDGHHSVMSHHEDGHKHMSHHNADGKPHDVHSAHAHSMHAHTGEEPPEAMTGGQEAAGEGAEEAEEAPMIPGMRG